MRRAPWIASCSMILAAALFAHADEVDDFADVVGRSLASPHPMIAFYEGLAAMNDFDLGEDDVQLAMTLAGAPSDGPIGESLISITRIQKLGDDMRIERSKSVLAESPEGFMKMSTLVRARFRIESNGDVRVERIRGVSVGRSKYFMLPLRSVLYTTENGRPIARAKVGYWPMTRTMTIEIQPLAGLAGAVSGNP